MIKKKKITYIKEYPNLKSFHKFVSAFQNHSSDISYFVLSFTELLLFLDWTIPEVLSEPWQAPLWGCEFPCPAYLFRCHVFLPVAASLRLCRVISSASYSLYLHSLIPEIIFKKYVYFFSICFSAFLIIVHVKYIFL